MFALSFLDQIAEPAAGPLVWLVVITTTISSITAGIVAVIAARSKENIRKTDVIIEETGKIKASTDGNLSKVKESLAVANQKIEGLEKLVRSMVEGTRAADELARNPVPPSKDGRSK